MAVKEEESTSTELVKLTPRQLGIIEHLGIEMADENEIQWRIAERLAYANSLDELLDDAGPQGLRNHIGEPFLIRDVKYRPSAYPSNPFFAIIDAVTPDGEPTMYTSGALSVVVQLGRGWSQGWWDGVIVKAVYSTEQPGVGGNRPYKLVKA